MASLTKYKPSRRQQNISLQRNTTSREYGNILYGHKCKAAQNHSSGNPEYKRITRSKDQKSSCEKAKTAAPCPSGKCHQNAWQTCKIPLLQNEKNRAQDNFSLGNSAVHKSPRHHEATLEKQTTSPATLENFPYSMDSGGTSDSPSQPMDVSTGQDCNGSSGVPSNHPPNSEIEELAYEENILSYAASKGESASFEGSTSPEGSSMATFLEDFGLNSKDPPPNVSLPKGADIDILKILASMNQRLKALDNLEGMNSTLKGEITRVQTQVREPTIQ